MSMTVAQPGFIGGALEEVLSQVDPKTMKMPPEGSKGISGLIRQVMLKANEQNPGSFIFSQEEAEASSQGPVSSTLVQKPIARLQDNPEAAIQQRGREIIQQLKQPVGVAALGNRQNIAEKLAAMGRYDDDEIAHVAEGEVIVPAPIMKYYPEIKEQIFTIIRNEGLDPNEFVVGDEMVARNPYTGMQEFGFLSKAWKKIKKVVKKAAPIILAAAGLYFLGPAGVGAFGSKAALGANATFGAKVAATAKAAAGFAAANPGTAGFIAGTTTGLAKGKNLKDSLKLGLQAGAVTGSLGNVFGTEGIAKFASNPATAGGNQMIAGQQGIQNILAQPTPPLTGPGGSIPKQSIFRTAPGKIGKFISSPDALGKTVNYAGLGMIGMGLMAEPEEMVDESYEYEPTREGQAFPSLFYDPVTGRYSDTAPEGIRVIRGPIQRANAGGAVAGPGTGTSDSIPAMLSDGEFVMTAKAVRGMGDGSREKGAAKMYQLMNRLEGKA